MSLILKPRAILIDVISPDTSHESAKRRLIELELLATTYGGLVIEKIIQKRTIPDYQTYIGSGKLQEIFDEAKKKKIELLIINNLLKTKQLFEIEERARKQKITLKIWDRVDLILNIFAKHAKTAEAKLQIKLAAIRHMGPRIFGMGMELMQQTGGTGTRGGAGETNIEIMKRHLAEQEKHFKKDLERIARSRKNHRERRDRMGFKTASLVGYTNAGKSSLLNALTNEKAYVANELFATLDTRIGKMKICHPSESHYVIPAKAGIQPACNPSESWDPGPMDSNFPACPACRQARRQARRWNDKNRTQQHNHILLSDTIGFIQDLPPQLIDAFRSTLDETVDADLILHVIDVSDPFMDDKIQEVEQILNQLGVSNTPKIYVFNKCDLVKKINKSLLKKSYKKFSPVLVSALADTGINDMKNLIEKKVNKKNSASPKR